MPGSSCLPQITHNRAVPRSGRTGRAARGRAPLSRIGAWSASHGPQAAARSPSERGSRRDPTLSAPGRVEQNGVSRWKHCHDEGPGVSGPKTDKSKRGHAAFGVRWPCLHSWGKLRRLTTDCGGIVQALDFQRSTPAGKAGLRSHQASRCKRQYRPMIGLSGLRPTPWRRRRRSQRPPKSWAR